MFGSLSMSNEMAFESLWMSNDILNNKDRHCNTVATIPLIDTSVQSD